MQPLADALSGVMCQNIHQGAASVYYSLLAPLSLSLSVSLSRLSVSSICLCLSPSLSLSVCLCLSVSFSVCLSPSLSVCLSLSLSLSLSPSPAPSAVFYFIFIYLPLSGFVSVFVCLTGTRSSLSSLPPPRPAPQHPQALHSWKTVTEVGYCHRSWRRRHRLGTVT